MVHSFDVAWVQKPMISASGGATMAQSHDESTAQAPVTPGARLRGLLACGGLIVAPEVFDGLSAHLARRTGFRAAYLTGAGVAASGFGLPDIGLVTGSEMAERASLLT